MWARSEIVIREMSTPILASASSSVSSPLSETTVPVPMCSFALGTSAPDGTIRSASF